MSTPQRKPRQSAAHWRSVIDQQIASGLSAPAFCSEHNITYQSFMRWRKKLALLAEPDTIAPFVELTATDSPEVVDPQWHIELDLAPGVQLRIAR